GDDHRDDPGERHPLRALRAATRAHARGGRRARGGERDVARPGHALLRRRAHHQGCARRVAGPRRIPRAGLRLADSPSRPSWLYGLAPLRFAVTPVGSTALGERSRMCGWAFGSLLSIVSSLSIGAGLTPALSASRSAFSNGSGSTSNGPSSP